MPSRLVTALFGFCYIKENQDSLPTLYWLPNFINDLIKHVSLQIQTANFMPYCCQKTLD